MDTVAELSRNKIMPDVTDIKNLSDKEGIRIIIELRKDADVKQNINILYKKAKLEDTFGYNATLLSHKKPSIMSVSRILKEYLEFYREVLTRKYQSLLDKETKAAEIKAGLIKAVDIIDTIVEVLRGSKKVETAKRCLIDGVTKDINFKTKSAEKQAAKLCFTELQANAILEMRLQKLIGLELDVLTKELAAHNKNISEYSSLLNSKTKMTHKMRDEMLEIKKQYAKPRKTDVVDAELVVIKPQEVKPEKMWVLVNRFGYIKLIDEATKNRNQASLDKDYKYVCEVMNTGTVFVFTMNGKCHLIKAMNIPYGKYTDKGVPVDTLCGTEKDDEIIAFSSDIDAKQKLLFVTKLGFIKLVPVSEFVATRKTIDATKLINKDCVLAIKPIKDENIVLVTGSNLTVSFNASGVSVLKRNSVGIIGIKLAEKDYVETVIVCDSDFTYNGKHYLLKDVQGKRGSKGKSL